MKDYYDILGVSRNASGDDIKRAYRKLAHEHHPDKKGGDEKKFKEINEAYQILGDEQKRQQYDRFGKGGFSAQGGPEDWDFSNFGGGFNADLGDIFEDFLGGLGGFSARGGQGRRRERGSDISLGIDASFQ